MPRFWEEIWGQARPKSGNGLNNFALAFNMKNIFFDRRRNFLNGEQKKIGKIFIPADFPHIKIIKKYLNKERKKKDEKYDA